ncbi:MAG: ATP-grasp domain-containing protein, partial [Chitinophagales bacterium]
MNLHEYQGKELLKRYGVPVQEGFAVESVDAAIEAAKQLKNERGTSVWV